jgi:hypothetical protein
MKKILLLLISLILLIPTCFAEGYPPKGGRDQYPIYWYLYRHGDKLKKELDTRHFFRLRGWGCKYLVRITPDGTVTPLEVVISQNKRYDKSIKKIISTTKAEPFGDEIKLDELVVEVYLCYETWGEYVDIWYGNNEKLDRKVYKIVVQTTR